jgi:hypothetical protein
MLSFRLTDVNIQSILIKTNYSSNYFVKMAETLMNKGNYFHKKYTEMKK